MLSATRPMIVQYVYGMRGYYLGGAQRLACCLPPHPFSLTPGRLPLVKGDMLCLSQPLVWGTALRLVRPRPPSLRPNR